MNQQLPNDFELDSLEEIFDLKSASSGCVRHAFIQLSHHLISAMI